MSSKLIQPSDTASLIRESLSSLRMIQHASVPVTITLYGTETCLHTTAIKILLTYKRVPFVFLLPPEGGVYKTLVPNGKVPAIVHNDFVVTEPSVIFEYLEENFSDLSPPLLIHRNSQKNALSRYACRVHDTFIEPAVHACLAHVDLAKRDKEFVDAKMAVIAEHLLELERVCDSHGPFYCGDQMTMADCVLPGTLLLLELLMDEFYGHGLDYIKKFPRLGSVRSTHLNHFAITSILMPFKESVQQMVQQLKVRIPEKPVTPRTPRKLSARTNSLPKIV